MNAPTAFVLLLGFLSAVEIAIGWPDPAIVMLSGLTAGFCFGSAFTSVLHNRL